MELQRTPEGSLYSGGIFQTYLLTDQNHQVRTQYTISLSAFQLPPKNNSQ
jgi:hypothetical protein